MTEATLPETAVALLPDPGERARCAEFTRHLLVDPVGSAISAAMLVLIEVPLQWPKPVFAHRQLNGWTTMMDSAIGPARVLAVRPSATSGPSRVWTYWRSDRGTQGLVHRFDSPAELSRLRIELGTGPPPSSSFICAETAPERALLVCTQGSHDVCCGTDGMRYVIDTRERHPDLPIFQVSHTGGHRFAPTAMLLPEGRMWAYMDPELLHHLLHHDTEVTELADRCRGWWGAPAGYGQAAERAVFAQAGWTWEKAPRRRVDVADNGDDTARCEVSGGGRSWLVDVEVNRVIPTITCRAPGGVPAKPGVELRVTACTERGDGNDR